MRATIPLVIALIATSFIAGCLDNTDEESPAPTTSPSAPAAKAAEPLKMTVTASDVAVPPGTTPGKPYGWTPKTFTARVNDTIDIVLKGVSTNQLTHNLMIENNPDPKFTGITGVKTETKNATFVALKAGSFKYYCAVGGSGPNGHRAMGMEGTLTIS